MQIDRSEVIATVSCMQIRGSYMKGADVKLWISVDDFSIRKLQRQTSMTANALKSAYEEFLRREKDLAEKLGRKVNLGDLSKMEFNDKYNETTYLFKEVFFNAVN
jgi:hypothetical protein